MSEDYYPSNCPTCDAPLKPGTYEFDWNWRPHRKPRKPPTSKLQEAILLALADGPISSVSALAEKIDYLRPSVSRACGSLERRGLIVRNSNAVALK